MKQKPGTEQAAKTVKSWLRPFLVGFATVLPILGTGWVLVLVFKLLHRLGLGFIEWILRMINQLADLPEGDPRELRLEGFPGDDFLWLLIPLVLLCLMGLAVMNKPGQRVLSWIDSAMERLPVVGFVYSTLKQFMDAVKNLGGEQKFKGVAYVEYPSPGCRLIGFITGNYRDPQTEKEVTAIFLPTSPNPMTGFVVVVDDEKVMKSSMSLEEAGKMILSAGLVAPEAFAADLGRRSEVDG